MNFAPSDVSRRRHDTDQLDELLGFKRYQVLRTLKLGPGKAKHIYNKLPIMATPRPFAAEGAPPFCRDEDGGQSSKATGEDNCSVATPRVLGGRENDQDPSVRNTGNLLD